MGEYKHRRSDKCHFSFLSYVFEILFSAFDLLSTVNMLSLFIPVLCVVLARIWISAITTGQISVITLLRFVFCGIIQDLLSLRRCDGVSFLF